MTFFTEKLDAPCSVFVYSEDFAVFLVLYRVASAQAFWLFVAEDVAEKKCACMISVKSVDAVERQVKRCLEATKKSVTVQTVKRKEQIVTTTAPPLLAQQNSTTNLASPQVKEKVTVPPIPLSTQASVSNLKIATPSQATTTPAPTTQQQQVAPQSNPQVELLSSSVSKLENDIKIIRQELETERANSANAITNSLTDTKNSIESSKAILFAKVEELSLTVTSQMKHVASLQGDHLVVRELSDANAKKYKVVCKIYIF